MNPLSSELGQSGWLRRSFDIWHGALWALVFGVLGGLAVGLAWLADAACMWFEVSLDGRKIGTPVHFGFLYELNHGPIYLIGIPILILVAHALVTSSENTLERLAKVGRLTLNASNGATAEPLDWISRRNKTFFRRIAPAALLLSLTWHGWSEWRDYNKTYDCSVNGREGSVIIGWVQANLLADWATRARQGSCINWDTPVFAQLVEAKGGKQNVVGMTLATSASPAHDSTKFKIFVFFALAVAAIDAALALLIGVKIIWILVVMGGALPSRRDPLNIRTGLRLSAFLYDTKHRYGLTDWFDIYKRILLIVMLVGLNVVFSFISNTAKGSSVHQLPGLYATQYALWSILSIIAIIVIFGPPLFASYRLGPLKAIELAKLDMAENAAIRANDAATQDKILIQKDTVKAQNLWPTARGELLVVALAAASLVGIPATFIGVPNIAKILDEICPICENVEKSERLLTVLAEFLQRCATQICED